MFRPALTGEEAVQAEYEAWAARRLERLYERVYWDEPDQEWRCRCQVYASGRVCRHLARYRPTVLITFCDEWRDCF